MADVEAEIEQSQNEVRAVGSRRILMFRTDLWHFKQDRSFVDWAHALQANGHQVLIVTCGYHPGHCLEDIMHFPIVHVGSWIPRALMGRFKRFFYLARTVYCAVWVAVKKWASPPHLVINCTNPVSIPILKYFGKYQVLHMMNFAEVLSLDPKEELCLHKPWYYRLCLVMATEVFVESRAARQIYDNSFHTPEGPKVCYPCVDLGPLRDVPCCELKDVCADAPEGGGLYVCFGCMRASSNFELVLDAFEIAMEELPWEVRKTCHLIIAGHVSEEFQENVSYYQHLQRYAVKLKYGSFISIVKRLPLQHRKTLIKKCLAVIQTSLINHTNCRPILEAMYFGKTVLATNIGVHNELIHHRVTGYLLEPEPKMFAHYIYSFARHKMLAMNSGFLCEIEYKKKFGFKEFSKEVEYIIHQILNKHADTRPLHSTSSDWPILAPVDAHYHQIQRETHYDYTGTNLQSDRESKKKAIYKNKN